MAKPSKARLLRFERVNLGIVLVGSLWFSQSGCDIGLRDHNMVSDQVRVNTKQSGWLLAK